MTTDYMPRALTSEDIQTGNLFHLVDAEEATTGKRSSTHEESAPLADSDHDRWQAMVDNGMPAGIAYRIIQDGIERRKATDTYRVTVIEAPENMPPHSTSEFNSSYGTGKAWKPRHRVQAADCPDAPAHIINRKLRELPNDRVKWPARR